MSSQGLSLIRNLHSNSKTATQGEVPLMGFSGTNILNVSTSVHSLHNASYNLIPKIDKETNEKAHVSS